MKPIARVARAVALVAAFSISAEAAEIVMSASDPAGIYSYSSGANWTGGRSPAAGNRYFTGANALRGNSAVFAGNSLQVDAGGQLLIGADTRAGHLTVSGGTLASSGGGRNLWSSGNQIVVTTNSVFDGSAGTLTIHSPISGPGGITIKGSVTFYNDFVNYGSYKDRWWYEGDTVVNSGGTLNFSYIYPPGGPGKGDFVVNGVLTLFRTANINGLSGSGTVNVGSTWSLGNGDASGDFAGVLAGGGTLTVKTGSGTQILRGANTYTGPTTVKGGALLLDYSTKDSSKLPDAGALTLAGGAVRLAGGTHTEIVASTRLHTNTASRVSRDAGSALLRMNALTRNAGSAVDFGAENIADTDTANVNGILGGWATVNGRDWAVNSTATGTNDAIAALAAYSGELPAAGGLATANYTQTGTLAGGLGGPVAANTVRIANAADSDALSLGPYDLTITSDSATSLGGILYVGGSNNLYAISGTTGRILPSTAGQELIFNVSTGALTVSACIGPAGAAGAMTKAGPGTLVLGAANTYTGMTAVNGGTLAYGLDNAIGGGPLTVNGADAVLALGSFSDAVGAVTLTAGAITGSGTLTAAGFTVNNDLAASVGCSLAGSGAALAKSGSGILTISRPCTYTGTTTISGGVLAYGCDDAIGAGAIVVDGRTEGAQGAVLDLGPYRDTVGAVTVTGGEIAGSGTLTASGFTFNGGIWGSYFGGAIVSRISASLAGAGAGVTKSNVGVTILSGTNTYAGATVIDGGVLRASDGTSLPTNSLLSITGASLGGGGKYAVFETGANLVRPGGSAAGQMRITGGTSGFSAHGGPVTVAFGTLDSPTALTWGVAPFQPANLVLNAIYADSALEFRNPINLNGAMRTVIVETQVATLSGVLSGAGSSGLAKGLAANPQYDAGTLVLAAANTYEGATAVNYGTLNIRHDTALGTTAGGTTVAAGAALELEGGVRVGSEALSLNGTGIDSGGALRSVEGNNAWQGTVTLAGAARINCDAGSLALEAATHSVTGLFGLTLGGAGTGTIRGTVTTGAGALTKDGAGTWTLAGANTYTGATAVNAGTLRAGTATLPGISGAFGVNSAVTLANAAGAVLNLAGYNTHLGSLAGGGAAGGSVALGGAILTVGANGASATYAGVISGAGGVTKIGTGTQTLSGANAYVGDTRVQGGTLSLTQACLSDTRDVRLYTGATLNLNFSGTDTVLALYINSSPQPAGIWGRIGSAALGAQHETTLITGNGLLNVQTSGAASGFLLLVR